ncbi:GNAT family N-acetyltransferase [Luteolibacter sp. Populi]|uniref:GNAT family N-acetyltransferase n=1 Tax=Luteolibacter sp. Populi TaxID=3230487 RepID=UPI003467CB4C
MTRRYQPGDHLAIGRIFHEAVHQLASNDYTPDQLLAWSNGDIDFGSWQQRCGRKRPFVKELDGRAVGFMELDPDGHIDCTYVDPAYARRGVMSEIMAAVKREARAKGIAKLFAEVSITARPFFARHGFRHVRDNEVHVRGETLTNFIMECHLEESGSPFRG